MSSRSLVTALWLVLACASLCGTEGGGDLQRTHWYALAGSPTGAVPGEYVDYHLAPEPAPAPATAAPGPHFAPGHQPGNVTARLGQTVSFRWARAVHSPPPSPPHHLHLTTPTFPPPPAGAP